MEFFIYAILAIIGITFLGGFYFSSKVIKPKVNKYEFTRSKVIENNEFDLEAFSKWESEEVWIESEYGYKLHGFYFPAENSKKSIIFCHGITWSLWGSIKYAEIFRELGFNILIYDHRNHGKSGGNNTTFGFYEKYDLSKCISWLKKKVGNDTIIGTHGESLGAATALQNLAIDSRVDFCVADCAFSNLVELLKLRMRKDFHLLPFPIINISNLFIKIRSHFSINDISPINDIKSLKTPVLFIHGQDDRYIPPCMSVDMHKEKNGENRLILIPGARHAQSILMDRKRYKLGITDFLAGLKII